MRFRKLFWSLFILLFSTTAFAAHEIPVDVPDPLSFDRREASSRRFEISPFGGDYFGDKLNHSFIVGGNLQYNFTEILGISANFGWSKMAFDRTSALGASIVNDNEFLIDGGLIYNLPAAYASPNGVTEMDFFTSLGAGVVRTNNSNHLAGYLGGGIKIRPGISWLAIRVEVRDYFTSINNPGGSDFENDVTFMIGPTFLLPPEI